MLNEVGVVLALIAIAAAVSVFGLRRRGKFSAEQAKQIQDILNKEDL